MGKRKIRQPIRFEIILTDEANGDIVRIGMTEKDVAAVCSFLQTDACRLLGQRQRQLCPQPDLWYVRCCVNGRGKQSGGRLIYCRKNFNGSNVVTVIRFLRKNEVEYSKEKMVARFYRIVNKIIDEID